MALSAKLQLRQSQSLVMTPQLMQSIRLLQYSHLELNAYIAREIEKNPLLELTDEEHDARLGDQTGDGQENADADAARSDDAAASFDGQLETSIEGLEGRLGTSLENVFDQETAESMPPQIGNVTPGPLQAGILPLSMEGEAPDLEAYCAQAPTLRDHLLAQLPLAFREPSQALIAAEIIDSLDEDGYMRRPLSEIADNLNAPGAQVEKILSRVQTFDPSGVGARNLAECLSIQLRELSRLDPAMQRMLKHLDLLARRDFAALSRICAVDNEDIAQMVREIRALEPRPGSRFSDTPLQPAIPDVFVRSASDGGWAVELNSETLPKVLVNREYYATVSKACTKPAEKAFMTDCLQNANWLVKSLDQRAQTVLKVATEIVKQQDMFLAFGVGYLRPLNLKMVADAINMHESTVSRVTTNKYMQTSRGIFELKYFFTAAIPATGGQDSHSAESVRHRIRQMIEAETADKILSDDAIVNQLRESGIDVARRTVAKYRELLNIPSSVQRRREKRSLLTADA